MDQQNKKTNPILWFLFAIVIPMVVMLVLIYTVLLLAGVDVNSWLKNTGKKVPVISAMITTDEEKSYQELEEKFNELKDEHDTTTNSYLTEIESYKSTIEQLENEIDKLEAQLEFAKDNSEEETSLTASDEEMIKKLSASRSEERRVGKEWRSGKKPDTSKKEKCRKKSREANERRRRKRK